MKPVGAAWALVCVASGAWADDARALLRERQQPDDRWEWVRPAMLELATEKVHRRAKFGYCRCGEPVAYVQKVLERYGDYRQLIPDRP